MTTPKRQDVTLPTLVVILDTASEDRKRVEFTSPFRIGRSNECDVCIKDAFVSRFHAEVYLERGDWWIRDLNSGNGIYREGLRVQRVCLSGPTTIRLGVSGPKVSFEVAARTTEERSSGVENLGHYIHHYFQKTASDAGEHTILVRKAFALIQSKQQRRYRLFVAMLMFVVIAAGGYAILEHQQTKKQRSMAKSLFYTMKSLDVDIANLERVIAESHNQQGTEELRKYESRRADMERNYDLFLSTLHIYNQRMTEEERLIIRVTRIFGECELDMPPDFVSEVRKYIGYWKSSKRWTKGIQKAKENGYVPSISRELLAQELPPQFFYLALQESGFDPYVSGPPTRKGIAKGMWQFIPETAVQYGLKLGPLVDLRRPDPGDDRHHYDRETKAAAKYLKDLYSTDAQASGLLVMACYDWGQDRVLPLVRSMPASPRDRNFWKLLVNHKDMIPKETYDYVFYITSAAVIGENPRLFGFDFDNPLLVEQ